MHILEFDDAPHICTVFVRAQYSSLWFCVTTIFLSVLDSKFFRVLVYTCDVSSIFVLITLTHLHNSLSFMLWSLTAQGEAPDLDDGSDRTDDPSWVVLCRWTIATSSWKSWQMIFHGQQVEPSTSTVDLMIPYGRRPSCLCMIYIQLVILAINCTAGIRVVKYCHLLRQILDVVHPSSLMASKGENLLI